MGFFSDVLGNFDSLLTSGADERRDADAHIEQGYGQAANELDPYAKFGREFGLEGLKKLMGGEVDLFSLPGVMKSFNSGADAIMRQMSATGMRGSGNSMLGLADYTGNFSRNLYNDEFGRGLGLAQLGQGSASDLASLYASRGRDLGGMDYQWATNERGYKHDIGMKFMNAIPGVCYVAEELYGKEDEKTYVIRQYVGKHLEDDSELGEFFRQYRDKGKRWVEFIKNDAGLRERAKEKWDSFYEQAVSEGV